MISDDERRAVAQKLRNAVECHKYDLNDDPDYSPFTASNVLLSMFDRFPRYSDLLHLADLIDRPTTTRHSKFKTKYGSKTPCCEVCGYSIGDMRWNYCPKCGAVIADD